MSVLLLTLSGPMQSWGHSSRFANRDTGREPTKSGVLGLLAAAQGRRRTDPVGDLVDLRFGVRTDQPGRVLTDLQTARRLDGGAALPLTTRQYLADAAFVAGIEGEEGLLQDLRSALESPRFAPFLGRRAFAPSRPLYSGIVDGSLQDALSEHPWIASDWWRRKLRGKTYLAPVTVDAEGWTGTFDEAAVREDRIQDVPISWDVKHREYGWRPVRRYWVPLGGDGVKAGIHSPMEEL